MQSMVVATDPCGSITYTYAFYGEQLTLDMIDDQCVWGKEQIAQTILGESAPFTKVDARCGDSADGPATYSSTSFVVPFEVTLPRWAAPEPAITEPNFVTWEGTDADRGTHVLAPVNLYPPGSTTTTPLPDDYISYLMSQTGHGATFSDVTETTIDGLPRHPRHRDYRPEHQRRARLPSRRALRRGLLRAATRAQLAPRRDRRRRPATADLGPRHQRRRRRIRHLRHNARVPPLRRTRRHQRPTRGVSLGGRGEFRFHAAIRPAAPVTEDGMFQRGEGLLLPLGRP